MSRTYKKVPGFKDRNPFMKNYSNRRLRRLSVENSLASGGAYRKHTCPWDICDWKWFYFSKQEMIEHGESRFEMYPHRYKSREHAIKKEIARARSK